MNEHTLASFCCTLNDICSNNSLAATSRKHVQNFDAKIETSLDLSDVVYLIVAQNSAI